MGLSGSGHHHLGQRPAYVIGDPVALRDGRPVEREGASC
jgi:hypothetical protein